MLPLAAYSRILKKPASPKPLAVPKLLGEDKSPASQTLYVSIPLGSERGLRPMTGIYLPGAFQPRSQVDVIVYFHGHRILEKVENTSIDCYWNSRCSSNFLLRQSLKATGKNLILVAPTLGPRSEYGWLGNQGGLDRYMQLVLSSLRAHVPAFKSGVSLRHLLLACHSGGGSVMRRAAIDGGATAANIGECWGFDCNYDSIDPKAWRSWARQNPTKHLHLYWAPSKRRTTEKNAKAIGDGSLSNAHAYESKVGHMKVPVTYWEARINAFAASAGI